MIEYENETTLYIDIAPLEVIASTLTDATIELIIIESEAMQSLNLTYRKIDAPTDVLSFPLERPISQMPLGAIVVCESLIREKALLLGHSEQAEISLLFIHGLLHLLGHDHESDNGEMRSKEEELIRTFGLPASLIVRTQEDT